MQTPEPSLEESQQQIVSGEGATLDPSAPQAEHASSREVTPDKQENAQQPALPGRTGEVVQAKPAPYSEEDILKGLVYPPPPTFYEKMPSPVEPPVVHQAPPIRYVPEAARAATSYVPPKTPSPLPAVGSAPASITGPGSSTRQLPVKRSRTWVWVVVTIMAIALLASGSLCGWAVYNVSSNVFQTVDGIENTVSGFYSELQNKNYAQAYHYLALTGAQQTLTQEQFAQQASQLDSQYGPVLSYTPEAPALSPNASSQDTANITQSTITIQVGRKQKQYAVTLTLRKEGNSWKIVSYSQL
ncbi:MAG TPA: hypothetical protein VL485_15290 [Ktedonobacteraceae bacterium]|jgi:hypothetical protein|nr:hypothetical protein [Ktedonobacteraceae bacterium]